MKISVIIVNWNAGAYLERCLSALRKQTLPPSKTIIVDNNSTDGSLERVEALYDNIEIIRMEKNAGFARANNVAVRDATGSAAGTEWIALLNPDAFPEPQWLENLMKAAEASPEYSFFGSRTLMAAAADLLDGTGDTYHVSGLALRRGYGSLAENRYSVAEEVFSPCAAAALYRRDAFLEVNGFDEDYFCYFEDVDLAFRLRLAGHRCLYVPDAVVYHAGFATTGRQSDFAVYYGQRNLVWTFFKDMPLPLLLCYLPQHIFLNAVIIVWFSLRGQTRVILKAIRDGMLGIPRIWGKRRNVQALRKIDILQLRKLMSKGFPKR